MRLWHHVSRACIGLGASLVLLCCGAQPAQAVRSGVYIKSTACLSVANGRPVFMFDAWGQEHPGLAYNLVAGVPLAYPPHTAQDWSLVQLRPEMGALFTDEGSTDNWLVGAEINGAPACLFQHWGADPANPDKSFGGVALACARTPTPRQPQDWVVTVPVFAADWESERLALCALDGRPLAASLGVSAAEGEASRFGIRLAWGNMALPETRADLRIADAVTLSDALYLELAVGLGLAVADGLPVVAYSAPGATIAFPESLQAFSKPWTTVTLRSQAAQNICLLVYEDQAYILCSERTELWCGQCPVAGLKRADNWRWSLVDDKLSHYNLAGAVINGRLGALYCRGRSLSSAREPFCALAQTSTPRGPGDWQRSQVADTGEGFALVEVDGKPAAGIFTKYAVCYAYATCSEPRSPKDWRVTTVFEDQAFTQEIKDFDAEMAWQDRSLLAAFLANPVTWAIAGAVALILSCTALLVRFRLRGRRAR